MFQNLHISTTQATDAPRKLRALVEPESQADPQFQPPLAFTRMTAQAVRAPAGILEVLQDQLRDVIQVEPRHPAAAEKMTSAPDRSATPAHLGMLGTLRPDHSLTHCAGKKEAMRVGA
jgi:hypothetical protein